MGQPYTYQKNAFAVIVIFICLSLLGVNLLPKLDIQLNPSGSLSNLSIRYVWATASARTIEHEVTTPLEGVMAGMQGLKSISSVTYKGSGTIDLEFKKGVNMDAARFEVASLIRQTYAKLPVEVSYPELSLSTSGSREQPILTYTLSAPSNSTFIRKYAEENVIVGLSAIRGVKKVSLYGDTPYFYKVQYNPDQLNIFQITPDEVNEVIRRYFSSQYIGQGTVAGGNGLECFIAVKQRIGDGFRFGDIPVKKVKDRLVFLDDIATLHYQEKQPDAYFRVNGLNTLNLVVYPEDKVNNLELAAKVRAYMDQKSSVLPSGYELILTYDETNFIEKELTTILQRSLFSLVVLLVFVLIVSRELKYLFLIVSSILVNLIVALSLYYFTGLEIHLYSLAGITISLGMIIDSSIVMVDHLRNKGDKKVLIAILASTLTTVGALSAVFLLEENQQVNLMDFAIVITINLFVSVFVALYFIPALMEKVTLKKRITKQLIKRKRRVVGFSRLYLRYLGFAKRFQWLFFLILLFSFGIPVHWLPDKVQGKGFWPDLYNESLGGDTFQDDVKPILEKSVGGAFRLFTEYVFEGSYYVEPERTALHVRGTMPKGCTIDQLDQVVRHMEDFIGQFSELDVYNTSIYNPQDAHISIYFKPEYEWGSFPYILKGKLEGKAISLGGLDWSVYGVGRGFSNALGSGYRNSHIQLEGYNYEELYSFASQLKKGLLNNPRIKEVDIAGSSGWGTTNSDEYFLEFDNEKLAAMNIAKADLFQFIEERTSRPALGKFWIAGGLSEVVLYPDGFQSFDVWDLDNIPVVFQGKMMKINQLGALKKRNSGNDIYKHDQQYQLVVAYDFIGPDLLGKKVRDKYVEELHAVLPLGYQVFTPGWGGWNKDDSDQYYLIFYIVMVIFIICAILFESFRQPLSIILLIPISFTGVFLTFYVFDVNFDQGGLASFVMVAGLVVNSGIYILNDYNNLQKSKRSVGNVGIFLHAFNQKIIPILLTIFSTVAGLVPFLWAGFGAGTGEEPFWYAFACGSIGGLLFTLIGIFIFLPVFFLNRSFLSSADRFKKSQHVS